MKVITNRLMTIGDAILKKNKVIGVKKLPKEKKRNFMLFLLFVKNQFPIYPHRVRVAQALQVREVLIGKF